MSSQKFEFAHKNDLLQAQLAWYERALATSKDALWNWDLKTDALIFSEASHADLGYPDADKPRTMQTWCAHIHPEDAQQARDCVIAHLKGESPELRLTIRLKTTDDRWVHVLVTGQSTEWDENGRVSHCMGHMHEIDDQLRTELELARAQERFHLALRSTKCGFWSWDLTTHDVETYVYHDTHPDQAHERRKSTRDQVREAVHPDDLSAFDRVCEQYEAGQTGMIEGSWRVRSRTGSYHWILNRGEIIEWEADGRPKLAIGTHTDITSHKETELKLLEKTTLLDLAYQNTLESLWSWSPKTDRLYLSANWMRALERNQLDDLTLQDLLKRVHPNDLKDLESVLSRVARTSEDTVDCEFRILVQEAGYIWVRLRGHAVRDETGLTESRLVGTLSDVSRLKEKTLQLQKNEHQMELAMRGSYSSLFDFNVLANTFEIRSYHESADGIEEQVHFASMKQCLSAIHPDDRGRFIEYMRSFVNNCFDIQGARWRSSQFTETYRWTQAKGRVAERDAEDRPLRVVGTYQDIHDQVVAEQQADLEHQRLICAFEGTGDAVWDMDLPNGTAFVSQSWIESLGYNPQNWRYELRAWSKLIHPEDKPATKAALTAHLNGETPLYFAEYRVQHRDGKWSWVLARGKIMERAPDGTPTRVIGTLFNINRRKQIEQNLASAKELAETTLQAIADAVLTTDEKGNILSANSTALHLIDLTLDEVTNRPLDQVIQLFEEESRDVVDNPALYCMASDLTVEMEGNTLLRNQSGAIYAVQCKASPIHGAGGKPIGSVLILQDITASRDLTREIEHRSKHDPLTQLINRYEFELRLKRLLQQHPDGPHALCYMDLDQFKLVNDTCGHMAGDELLRQLSTELKKVVRHTDSLGRLGGDEFGLLMENCSMEQAQRVAHDIHRVISGFSFSWEDKQFKLGVSLGLVAIDAHISPQLALQHADAACFVAKEQGRNRIHIHQENDDQIALRQGEMGWIPRIQRALDEDLFELYSQAIIDLDDPNLSISHFEILIRMRDGDQSIPPGAFLPAAERYNLSPKLDQWVITHALRIMRKHMCSSMLSVQININLSAHSLNEPGFLDFIQQRIKDYGVDPRNLCFEITETAAIANLTQASHFIDTLKSKGCAFALDDFGSGLSSFAYLKNFPVDYLKIDGSFIKEIVDDQIDAAMVKSINEIGHIMNKKTVAEWVENEAIVDRLKAIGVNYAQGYHFSVPEPFDQALERLCTPSQPERSVASGAAAK